MSSIRFTIITVLIIVLVYFIPPAVSAKKKSTGPKLTRDQQTALYNAQQSIKKKKHAQARQTLLAYLKKHPKKPHYLIYYVLGNAWQLDGNVNEAYRAYEKGLKLNPSSGDLALNMAGTAYDLKRFKKAGELFEKAYRLNGSKKPELLYQAAASYYSGKSPAQAKSVLVQLLRLQKNPETKWVQLYLHICLDLEDWKTAGEMVKKLLEKEPGKAEYWRLSAQLHLRRKDYKSAVSDYEVAYGLKAPTNDEWKELGNLYLYISLPGKALRCFEKSYGPSPSVKNCLELARTAEEAGLTERAVHYLDAALRQHPSADNFLEKGRILYEHGDCANALKSLKTCVQKAPRNGLAHLLIGYCEMESGHLNAAKASLEIASQFKAHQAAARNGLTYIEQVSNESNGVNSKEGLQE